MKRVRRGGTFVNRTGKGWSSVPFTLGGLTQFLPINQIPFCQYDVADNLHIILHRNRFGLVSRVFQHYY